MKKLMALFLGAAMLATSICGLAACKPDEPEHTHTFESGWTMSETEHWHKASCEHTDQTSERAEHDFGDDDTCDVCGYKKGTVIPDNPGPGPGPGPDDPVVPTITRPTDPREEVYEVYSADGTLVKAYRSLALAIEAAYKNDKDAFEDKATAYGTLGSYVKLQNGKHILFQNRKGYEEGKGDIYYYYDNNGLAGNEYWSDGVPLGRAQGSELVTYQIGEGQTPSSTSSGGVGHGYRLYDGLGQDISKSTEAASISGRGWENIYSQDANVKYVPARSTGVTGAEYTLDMSEVKIYPTYDGVNDTVYAFLGFVVANGQGAMEVGIACDTTTGLWKEYTVADAYNHTVTVRTTYNIGSAVLTSTWNEEGYFVPDVDELVFKANATIGEDDLGEEWEYVDYTIKADGKEILHEYLDAEFYNENGGITGFKFDKDAGLFFSAGLDVVKSGAEYDDSVGITDFTNGAAFQNIVVTDAKLYFPTEDEIPELHYGMFPADTKELRGQWVDVRGQAFKGVTAGVYNYTYVALSAYSSYTLNDDSQDVLSFSYIDETLGENEVGGALKTYQDEIDKLLEINAENASTFRELIQTVGGWYANGEAASSTMPIYCYLAADWTVYTDALKIYNESVGMTTEAENLLDEFDELLPNLDVAIFKGYKKADEGEAKDYLYNAVFELFSPWFAEYNKLPDTDHDAIESLPVAGTIARWVELYNNLLDIENGAFGRTMFTLPNLECNALVSMTGAQLVADMFDTAATLENEYIDVPTLFVANAVESRKSVRVLYIRSLLAENNVELGYLDDFINLLGGADSQQQNNGAGMVDDWDNYFYPVFRQIARIRTGECTYLDAELAEMINTYMLNKEKFGEPNNNWGLNAETGDSGKGSGQTAEGAWTDWYKYFEHGAQIDSATTTLRKFVQDNIFVTAGIDLETGLTPNGMGVTEEVTALDEAPGTLTENGTTVLGKLNELLDIDEGTLSDLFDLTPWTGWSTDGGATAGSGYLYDELSAFNTVYDEFKALEGSDRALIRESLDETNFKYWAKLSDEYAAIVADQTQVTILDTDWVNDKTTTKAELVGTFIKGAFWHNSDACDCGDGKGTSGQGYFCFEHQNCWQNALYTLYLNKMLEANGIRISYINDDLMGDLLKNQGTTNNDLTGIKAGESAMRDFDYLWYVGKQIGRIIRRECTYLNDQLAWTINHYMVTNEKESTTGWGTNKCFHNGTWAWAYYAGTPGAIKSFNSHWMNCFDKDVSKLTGGNYWNKAVKYLTDLLTASGYEHFLAYPKSDPSLSAMLVSAEVKAQKAPSADDDLKDVAEAPKAVITAFRTLGDLTDITAHSGWNLGDATLESDLTAFASVKEKYDALGSDDQAVVLEKVGEENYERWETLSTQFAAIDNTERNITVVNITNDSFTNTVTVTKQNLFTGFLNALLFHNRAANCSGSDFLCCEDDPNHWDAKNKEECFRNSFRALYLRELLKENDVQVDYVEELIGFVKNYSSTKSGYTGLTNEENVIRDFEYLYHVGKQIGRIIRQEINYVDEEMANVINTYMIANGTGDKSAEQHGYGCYESFYNGTISYAYRVANGDLYSAYIPLKAYFDTSLVIAKDGGGYMTWSELLSTYLNPLIVAAGGTLVNPRNGTNAPMVIESAIEAQSGPAAD